MRKVALILTVILSAASRLRAEDVGNTYENLLEKKCAEARVALIEVKSKSKPGSAEVAVAQEICEELQKALEMEIRVRRDILIAKQKAIEAQIQALKDGPKDPDAGARYQVLEQARGMIARKLLELDYGPMNAADDPNRMANVKQMLAGQNSKIHVKLANGMELDAEGPWLQNSPEAREIIEQFTDPAKDGAISFRVPDHIDPDALAQVQQTIQKIAPKVTLEYAEKLHLVSATSDDPMQLRRAAGVFKALRMGNGFDGKMKGGDFNPGGGKPPLPPDAEMKKKKGVDDKF